MSAWHTVYEITRENTIVRLQCFQATAPGSVPKLPLVNKKYLVEFKFSDDWGNGVMTRRLKLTFYTNHENQFLAYLRANLLNLRIVVIYNSQTLMKGYVDRLSLETPLFRWDPFELPSVVEKGFSFDVTFIEGLSTMKGNDYYHILRLIESSPNPLHEASVPVIDFISQFLIEGLERESHTMIAAHYWEFKRTFPSVAWDKSRFWLTNLEVDRTKMMNHLGSVEDAVNAVVKSLGCRLGWSVSKSAWVLLDQTYGAAGQESICDPTCYDGEPAIYNKVSSGIRTTTPTTLPIQTLNVSTRKPYEAGRKQFEPTVYAITVTTLPGDETGFNLFFGSSNDLIPTAEVYEHQMPVPQDLFKMLYETDPAAWRVFWLDGNAEQDWRTILAHQYAYLRMGQHYSFEATFPPTSGQVLDPMLPILLKTPADLNDIVFWVTEGAWDIVDGTTRIKTISYGEYRTSYWSKKGLLFDDWY